MSTMKERLIAARAEAVRRAREGRIMACRRCSDCEGLDHHWLDNEDFGNDPAEAECPTGNEYVCKHCEAVGDECWECEGSGEIEDGSAEHRCPKCGGEGVILSHPRSFVDYLQWAEGGDS